MKFVKVLLPLAGTLCLLFPGSVSAAAATLTLTPVSTSIAVGGTTTLDVTVNSGGARTIGTDVIVRYDPARLEYVSLTKGNIYSSYSNEVKDSTAGTIAIGGFVGASDIQTGVSVNGVFAKFTFKGKAPGTANVSFDFTPGSTADTNVVEAGGSGADILTSAAGSVITVSGGSAAAPQSSQAPVATSAPNVLPNAAITDPTVAVFLVGAILLALGTLGVVRSLLI